MFSNVLVLYPQRLLERTSIFGRRLEGHCHRDFSVFWSKLLNYLTRYLFANIKLLLEHQGENIK